MNTYRVEVQMFSITLIYYLIWYFRFCIGTIPSSIGTLIGITYLDMNNNKFIGILFDIYNIPLLIFIQVLMINRHYSL